MDEEAVKTQGEETPTTDSPSDDQQTTQPTEEAQDQNEEQGEEQAPQEEQTAEPEEEEKPSKSENRFQKLANDLRATSEQLEQEKIEKQKILEQLTNRQQDSVQFDPNKEYTVEEYNAMLQQAQQQGIARASTEVETLRQEIAAKESRRTYEGQLQNDINYLEKTYPELNQESDQYDSRLHRDITEAYQEVAVYGESINPNVSLKTIGDRMMRTAREYAKSASAETSQKAATAASSAIQGDSVVRQNQEIDANWFATTYDPNNPDHRKIADDYAAKNQFK